MISNLDDRASDSPWLASRLRHGANGLSRRLRALADRAAASGELSPSSASPRPWAPARPMPSAMSAGTADDRPELEPASPVLRAAAESRAAAPPATWPEPSTPVAAPLVGPRPSRGGRGARARPEQAVNWPGGARGGAHEAGRAAIEVANHFELALDPRAVAADLESRLVPLIHELLQALEERLRGQLQGNEARWRAHQGALF